MFIQVTTSYDPVGQKRLSTKCPTCGSTNCLELTFYQKKIDTGFSKKITKKVSGILFCHHTQTEIAPVVWTDEIEHYFITEKSKVSLAPKSLKFTKWFYWILIAPTLIILGAIGYFQWEHAQFQNDTELLSQAHPGMKVMSMFTITDSTNQSVYGNTWHLVKKIEGDTLWLQQHREFTNDEGFDFDLDTAHFDGALIKVPLQKFKERTIMSLDYSKQHFVGYITEIKSSN